MAKKVGIYYDEKTIQSIMSGHEIETMEQNMMMQKKNEIEAAFFQKFGVQGKFEIRVVRSQNKTWNGGQRYAGRVIYRVHSADKKTGAILKAHPNFMKQFLR